MVGRGVDVGTGVLVAVEVIVAVGGTEVLVAVGAGAAVEQAERMRIINKSTNKMELVVLRCIYPP
jgi:hypothetical protein